MKKIIIFGASSGGQKVFNFIKQFHEYEICFFLDNSPRANEFLGLKLIQAKKFLENVECRDYYYCIGSEYRDEIYLQLINAGIDKSHIYSKIDILQQNKEYFSDKVLGSDNLISVTEYFKKSTLILDLLNGFGLGGVEKWSYNLASKYMSDREVILLGNKTEGDPPDEFKDNSYCIDVLDSNDYNYESIRKITDFIRKHLPCTVYCAHINDLLIACITLKQIVGERLKIVSVIHGGLPHILNDNIAVYEEVDYCLCVSPDSKKYMDRNTNDHGKKVLFKESPVMLPDLNHRKYTLDEKEPLKIAYAARLEKTHKHSELLLPLITRMEEENVNYKLDVAGDGTLFDRILEFVKSKNLQEKIKMLGRLSYANMQQFWLSHDVAINLSECEGCSIAMLESMSAGAVPIFTNVFSTEYFITDNWNGYVVPYNDIEKMVECIKELINNREKLEVMGMRSRKVIEVKCSLNDYVNYLNEHVI